MYFKIICKITYFFRHTQKYFATPTNTGLYRHSSPAITPPLATENNNNLGLADASVGH